jgi:BASS family bile acid:Na+ symporter
MTALVSVFATDIDDLQLHLSDGFQLAVKGIVALFLFGIALNTRISDFGDVARRPWVIAAGLVAQYAVMPALTLLLTLALDVRGSVAIGMILVVCCPAGNLSNLLTHRSRGDVALSVSLTWISTIAAVVVTPVALAFWCGLNPAAGHLLRNVHIGPWAMVGEAVLMIGLPFALGLLVVWLRPSVAERAHRYVEPAALTFLLLIVVAGLAGQFKTFVAYVGLVALAIVLQNALSLVVGYSTGRLTRLPDSGVRAMTFELGVRNTGLALVLALGFFSDVGGVAFVAAMWGLWDVITGLLLSTWWRGRPPADLLSAAPSTHVAPAG